MKVLYAIVHEKEDVHEYLSQLELDKVVFPKELSKLFLTDHYASELKTFYSTLGDVLILEPHSTKVDLEQDYFLYHSGIDEVVIRDFRKIVGMNGVTREFKEDFNRLLLEAIIKTDDDTKNKMDCLLKGIDYVIESITKTSF
jgi:hypothetical protein